MCHSQAEILRQEASVTKQSCPQLDTNDAEDEEDEEAQQQDVAQHGQRVQQQRDEDAHACGGRSHAGGARLAGLGWLPQAWQYSQRGPTGASEAEAARLKLEGDQQTLLTLWAALPAPNPCPLSLSAHPHQSKHSASKDEQSGHSVQNTFQHHIPPHSPNIITERIPSPPVCR